MIKNNLLICSAILILNLFGFATPSCNADMNENITTPVNLIYYGSFAGYDLPLKLIEKIDKETALLRVSYYLGYYNIGGQLFRVDKYIHGKLGGKQEYTYHENGAVKESITTNGNKVTTITYDQKGKEIGRK